MKDYKVRRLFSTPVFHFEIENYKKLNTELENYILTLKKNMKKDKKNQTMEDGILLFLIW